MSVFQLQRLTQDDYFEYLLQGAPSEDDWIRLIRQIRADADAVGYRRALINTFALTAPVDTMTRYWTGIEIGKTLGAEVRLGLYAPREQINHFMENVAHNCGGLLMPDDDRERLLAWLQERS